jgi:uncharacterized protein (DUF1330 family)
MAATLSRPWFLTQSKEKVMSRYIALGLAMLAGAALGATAVNGLHAQGKTPGAYVILDVGEIVDAGTMKLIVAKAAPAVKAGGGQYLARTEKITPLSGTPPKRVVILTFDSTDQAKAWYNSPAQQEINTLAEKALKQRWYIVDGAL